MQIEPIVARMFRRTCSVQRNITARFVMPMLLAFTLSACGKSSELEWTEDVKLPDGRVITLSRWVEFKGGSSHPGEASTESRQRFEFKNPDTGHLVKWDTDQKRGLLKTVALWIEGGRPLLLSEPAYGGDSRKYKCPNPPYLLFEHVDGVWRATPLSQVARKRIRANLTTHPLERRDEIEQSGRHVAEAQTSNSIAYYQGTTPVPHILQFEGMPAQTFDDKNCALGPSLNDLLFVEGK